MKVLKLTTVMMALSLISTHAVMAKAPKKLKQQEKQEEQDEPSGLVGTYEGKSKGLEGDFKLYINKNSQRNGSYLALFSHRYDGTEKVVPLLLDPRGASRYAGIKILYNSKGQVYFDDKNPSYDLTIGNKYLSLALKDQKVSVDFEIDDNDYDHERWHNFMVSGQYEADYDFKVMVSRFDRDQQMAAASAAGFYPNSLNLKRKLDGLYIVQAVDEQDGEVVQKGVYGLGFFMSESGFWGTDTYLKVFNSSGVVRVEYERD